MVKMLLVGFGLMFSLAACGAGSSGSVATTASNSVAAAETALTAAERLALVYTSLPRCSDSISGVCSNTNVVIKIKSLDNSAYSAVKAAERDSSLLPAAVSAISALKSAIPQ